MSIHASLRDNQTVLEVDGLLDKRRVLQLRGTAATPVNEWIKGGARPAFPRSDLHLVLDDAPTEDIPFLCHYLAGPLDITLDAKDLFSTSTVAKLALKSDALKARRVEASVRPGVTDRVFETPASQVEFQAELNQQTLRMHGDVQWWNGGSAIIAGVVHSKIKTSYHGGRNVYVKYVLRN